MGIYKRGNIYYVRVIHCGREIRRSVGPDRKAAEAVDAELRFEIAQAKAVDQPWTGLSEIEQKKHAKTFAEAANEYLSERKHKKPATLLSYQWLLNHYLLPQFGKLRLNSITEKHVAAYQVQLSERLSVRSVNNVMQLLRAILETAAKLLGHSSLEMVYRIYGRWIEDETAQEQQRLRDAFERGSR